MKVLIAAIVVLVAAIGELIGFHYDIDLLESFKKLLKKKKK